MYGPDGELVVTFGGISRFLTIIDPRTDTLISETLLSFHGPEPEVDFCEAFHTLTA